MQGKEGLVPVEVVNIGSGARAMTEVPAETLVKDLLAEVGMTAGPGQDILVNARAATPETRITNPSTVALSERVTGG